MTIEDLAVMTQKGFSDLETRLSSKIDNFQEENKNEHEEIINRFDRIEKIQTAEIKRTDNISVRVRKLEKQTI